MCATIRSMVAEAEAWQPTWGAIRRARSGCVAAVALEHGVLEGGLCITCVRWAQRSLAVSAGRYGRTVRYAWSRMVVHIGACARHTHRNAHRHVRRGSREARYEQGGLPTCSGRRPLTEAAGCVVRRLGGKGASVADIEGQTREGGE